MRVLALIALFACGSAPDFSSVALCEHDAPPADAPPPDAPAIRGLTLIAGQSNAVGNGVITEVDPMWADPFLAVHLSARTAKNIVDPPVITTYDGPLAPRAKFGAELSMGRALSDRDIAICAGGGFSLAVNWDPNGTYPSGGPNFYSQCVDWAHGVEAANNTAVTSILWFQGESDTTQLAWADAYEANLTEIAGRLLAEFPCARFLYYRLKTPGTYVTTVRAAQDAFAASGTPWVTMVNVDALPTFGQHFTSDGYLQLGEVFAAQVAALPARCP